MTQTQSTPSKAPPPQILEVGKDTYACIGPMGNSNSGFVVGQREVLVVDSRINPPLARQLKAEIEQVTDKPITYLVNTHFHGDHTFGNQVFADTAATIASSLTRERLAKEGEQHLDFLSGFFPVDYSEVEITPPAVGFEGFMSIDLGGRRVELVETAKGHTGGDVMVWVPDTGVLFTGDVLVVNQIPWLGHSPSSARLMQDLLDLTAGDVDTFVPGHGFNVTVAQRKDIFGFLGFLADVREQVVKLVDQGAELEEVQTRVDMSRYEGWRMADNPEWLAGNVERLYREIAMGEAERRHHVDGNAYACTSLGNPSQRER